jgi:putative integral membrane protein (TIGR02587 family)
MSVWQEIVLALVSVALLHGFVYNVELRGSHGPRPGETFWILFARFTIVGYALVLLVSVYVLWTFGRTDGTAIEEILSAVVVLSSPGALGAAAARVIL